MKKTISVFLAVLMLAAIPMAVCSVSAEEKEVITEGGKINFSVIADNGTTATVEVTVTSNPGYALDAVYVTVPVGTFDESVCTLSPDDFTDSKATFECNSAAADLLRVIPYFELVWSKGDADGDGSVNIVDALIVLRIACGLAFDNTPGNCDMDGDGSLTVSDALVVLRMAVATVS